MGVALLGYFGWQFFGTNYVSGQRHDDIASSLEKQWKDPNGKGRVSTKWGSAYAVVRIPRFGKDYEIPVLAGSTDEVFASGFGHFTGTAEPGQPGNMVLGAHRITHGEPLRDMPDLKPGDEVIVETATAVYTYTLDNNSLVVDFRNAWMIEKFPVDPENRGLVPDHKATLTLLTCSALFHTDGRSVAFGHLTEEATKT